VRFRTITEAHYRAANAVFLVYDVTNRASFEGIPGFLRTVRVRADPDCICILIGNKTDHPEPFAVSSDEAEAYARQANLAFIEIST
jgi:GTPase SAR1 family protein